MRNLVHLSVVAAILLVACSEPPLTIAYEGTNNGVARFLVENNSTNDVRAAQFSITFSTAPGAPLQVDTVRYDMAGDGNSEVPFVRAGEETFFAHATSGSPVAAATVLQVEFVDGSIWPTP